MASRRETQPIGTPDEIIDKLKALQWAISLETLVIHVFYGGMPREKAEKSLRLFAEKVLPAVHAMATPINPASLGRARPASRLSMATQDGSHPRRRGRATRFPGQGPT